MQLQFTFANGLQPVKFNSNVIKATPLELLIDTSKGYGLRQNALNLYFKSLDYVFRGVTNYATGSITGVRVGKSWFGFMEKNRDVVNWTGLFDKTYVVVYDISIDSITENMYIADAIEGDGTRGISKVKPVYIKDLLEPSAMSLKDNIIKSISVVTEYVSGYRLEWGYKGRKGLSVVDRKGRVISVDDIQDDETFILVKLLTLIMSKGNHLGVFLINGKGFSDDILNAFVETARAYYGDTFVFLSNCKQDSKVEREQLVLPNFLLK